MLKRQRRTLLLVRIGLAISVCLNVVFFKSKLLAAFVDLRVDADSLFPPITNWTVVTGALECMAVIVMVTASVSGASRAFVTVTRLLKYYFLVQLIVSVLELIADRAVGPLLISDICRFLALISLLVLIDFQHDSSVTRGRGREARRAALKQATAKPRLHT